MRIALVHPFAWPRVRRGGERYLDDLAWYLRHAGHDVDVVTGTRVGERLLRPARRFGYGPVETFGIRAFPKLVRRKYDVAHALTPTGALGARAAGHRTVFTVLGLPEPAVFADRPRQRKRFASAIARASAVAVLSAPAADEVAKGFGRTPVVLPPGVRLERFPPVLERRTGPPRILFASALDQRQKGLDVLVRAFGDVVDALPAARLMLAGPGDPSWALANAGRLRESIDIAGPGEPGDLPNLYRSSTVTVLPSQHEAFGLVLVESLASGTPVVGAVPGGPADIVHPSVGRLVPYGDATALARALREAIDLAHDPSVPPLCVAHAARWDWKQRIGPAHEAVYAEIARR